MKKIPQKIVINLSEDEDINLAKGSLEEWLSQGSVILNAAEIITVNINAIVKESIEACIQENPLTFNENILTKQLTISKVFLENLSEDCEKILRCIIYALLSSNHFTNKEVLDRLKLHTLKSQYLSLGASIHFVVQVVMQMKNLTTSLISNSDITKISNSDITKMLDSCFDYVITKLDNQDRSTILEKQHQGLARLRQEWLAGDADAQTETWNYLREALNPDSPSYSPVTL